MKSYRSPTGCERAGFESITHCQAPLGEVPLEQKGSWSTEEFQSGAGLRLPASVGSNPRYTWNHPPWHPPTPHGLAQTRCPFGPLSQAVSLLVKSEELRASNTLLFLLFPGEGAGEVVGLRHYSSRQSYDDIRLPLIG